MRAVLYCVNVSTQHTYIRLSKAVKGEHVFRSEIVGSISTR